MIGSLANSSSSAGGTRSCRASRGCSRQSTRCSSSSSAKGRTGHEAFQSRDPHVGHVLEDHVLLDRFDRRVDFRAGKTEPMHERFRHLRPEPVVAVEADPAGFVDACGGGLADVVKENAEDERERNLVRQKLKHQAGVLKNVAFGMELRRLRAAFHRLELGQDLLSSDRSRRAGPSRGRDEAKEKSAPALREFVRR